MQTYAEAEGLTHYYRRKHQDDPTTEVEMLVASEVEELILKLLSYD